MFRHVCIGIIFFFVVLADSFVFAEKTSNEQIFSERDFLDISHLIIKNFYPEDIISKNIDYELCLQPSDNDDFFKNKRLAMAQDSSALPEKILHQKPHVNFPTSLPDEDQKLLFPLGLSYETNKAALKAINKSLGLFSERMRERFRIWLERSARYVEIMQEVLKERNLPTELVFLPLIESGFNLNAYSKARAVGPWQFIESTGKRYGLIIDWWRDERKDPIKSTIAAANYLKDLYRMFGSWELALAAYNAGEGRISRALKKTYSDDYWSLLKTNQIRNETKNYVPHYMAATMIAMTPKDFGFHFLDYHEPLAYEEITLHQPVDIEVIAQCANTTVSKIRQLNAELRRWSTPPHLPRYTIKIPAQSKESFILNLDNIPHEERFSFDTYKVKKGGNIRKIASKLNIPAIAIIELNSFTGIENLKAGDVIKIPPKDKHFADMDDKMSVKKVSAKKKANKNRTDKKAKNGKEPANNNKPSVKTKKI